MGEEEEEATEKHKCCGMQLDVLVWLLIFCGTGVGLGLCYEFLELNSLNHAPAASASSFFLCFIGYISQTLVAGAYALSQPNPLKGSWTRQVILMLVLSSISDGIAQALDFFGQ